EPFFVAPAFEEDRAREQIGLGPFDGAKAEVRVWQEDQDPYAVTAEALKDRGISSGALGIEERTYFVYADRLAQAAPALKVKSAIPVTAGCRQIKSPAEIALMRLASAVTLKAYEAAWESLKEGQTQRDFAKLVSDAHKKLGFDGGAGVQVGEYSALP